MRILIAAVLTGTLLLAGCKKDDKADAKTKTAGSEDNPINAPLNYVAAEVAAKRSSERVLNMIPVTQAIQQFRAGEDRLPRDLNELVKSGYLGRIPEAPPGQQLWYNPATGEVKTVPITANVAPTGPTGRPVPPANTIHGFKARLPGQQQLPPE